MSEEEFKRITEYLDTKIIVHSVTKEPFDKDADMLIRLSVAYEELINENQALKKQLEEYDRKLFFTKNELDMRQKSIDNKLNQQKEFIDYLKYQVKLQEELNDKHLATGFEEILSKYKEIIGCKDEK